MQNSRDISGGIWNEFGWGDSETSNRMGHVASLMLVVACGVYGATVWLAAGLPPLAYFAARARTASAASRLPTEGDDEYR